MCILSIGPREYAGVANEVDAFASQLRGKVEACWNGEWFARAVLPCGKRIGDERLMLEVQPWALLGDCCGGSYDRRAAVSKARTLTRNIDRLLRSGCTPKFFLALTKKNPSSFLPLFYGFIKFCSRMIIALKYCVVPPHQVPAGRTAVQRSSRLSEGRRPLSLRRVFLRWNLVQH